MLTHIEEALLWMNKQVDDRIDRGPSFAHDLWYKIKGADAEEGSK